MINYAVANCGYVTRRLFAVVGECIVLGLNTKNSDIIIFNLTLRSKFHVIHNYKQQIIVCNSKLTVKPKNLLMRPTCCQYKIMHNYYSGFKLLICNI